MLNLLIFLPDRSHYTMLALLPRIQVHQCSSLTWNSQPKFKWTINTHNYKSVITWRIRQLIYQVTKDLFKNLLFVLSDKRVHINCLNLLLIKTENPQKLPYAMYFATLDFFQCLGVAFFYNFVQALLIRFFCNLKQPSSDVKSTLV